MVWKLLRPRFHERERFRSEIEFGERSERKDDLGIGVSEVDVGKYRQFRLGEFSRNYVESHGVEFLLFFRRVISRPSENQCGNFVENSLDSVISQHVTHSTYRRFFFGGFKEEDLSIPKIRIRPETRALHEFEYFNASSEKFSPHDSFSAQPIPFRYARRRVQFSYVFRFRPIGISFVVLGIRSVNVAIG